MKRPSTEELAALTMARLLDQRPTTTRKRWRRAGAPRGSPIPGRVGEPSPIKHVFYVIRENRTYDQVLGDLPQGNGDPTLTLFGEDVTPNAHALAREFVLLDNFYVDAEVSYDGHAFSTGGLRHRRRREAVADELRPARRALPERGRRRRSRNTYGNLAGAGATATSGTSRTRAGVSACAATASSRPGETERGGGRVDGHGARGSSASVHPSYPPYDLSIPDNQRVDVWLEEFRRFEEGRRAAARSRHRPARQRPHRRHAPGRTDAAGIRWPRTTSRSAGWSRRSRKSRFWKESAIFVLEDDAQNGPDHVDAHRSVLLVASPWTKRGSVDSHALHHLGRAAHDGARSWDLPPMSQYDAAATPAFAARSRRSPIRRPSRRARRASRSTRRTGPTRLGAQASLEMNLIEADLAPERELNEIVWKSIRGRDAVMPAPVRAAFVRPIAGGRRRRGRGQRARRAALNNSLTDRSRESGIPPYGRSEIPD